jgi:hypothetical protein
MFYKFREWYIPERMGGGIERYIKHGIPPGHFLTALLENDLFEAVGKADDENIANIPAYCAYFYNEAPSPCHGSKKIVAAWIKSGGNEGRKIGTTKSRI